MSELISGIIICIIIAIIFTLAYDKGRRDQYKRIAMGLDKLPDKSD